MAKGSFEVLPIVGVDASKAVMRNFGERAKLRFEPEKQEIEVDLHQVKIHYTNFLFAVCHRTKGAVAASHRYHKLLTILLLKALGRVYLFSKIMSIGALTVFTLLACITKSGFKLKC